MLPTSIRQKWHSVGARARSSRAQETGNALATCPAPNSYGVLAPNPLSDQVWDPAWGGHQAIWALNTSSSPTRLVSSLPPHRPATTSGTLLPEPALMRLPHAQPPCLAWPMCFQKTRLNSLQPPIDLGLCAGCIGTFSSYWWDFICHFCAQLRMRHCLVCVPCGTDRKVLHSSSHFNLHNHMR